ncbi:MAG: hypothetical protein AAGB34_06045 [Planctomycetota bacterium]
MNKSMNTLHTTEELIELAGLDAMGLLDESERERFDRSYDAAPPHVQAEIRRAQHRFASDHSLLPEVEAPASLRSRVLMRVREAMLSTAGTAGSISQAGVRSMLPIWRAAAIACGTAALVLGAYSMSVTDEANDILAQFNANQSQQQLLETSPRLREIYLSANKRDFNFLPASSDFQSTTLTARLMLDPDNGQAVLFIGGLPEAFGEYSLVVQPADQAPTRLADFPAIDGKAQVNLDNIDVTTANQLIIMGSDDQGNDMPILRSGDA